jgi:hypothetical protein
MNASVSVVQICLVSFTRLRQNAPWLATGMNRRRQAMPSQDGKATPAEPNGQSRVGFGRVPQRLDLWRAAVSIGRDL